MYESASGNQMTFAALKAKIVRIKIERESDGLFVATSPDLRGLLVAEQTQEALTAAIPVAIEAMYAACETPVKVTMVDRDEDGYQPWVAVPVMQHGSKTGVTALN